MRGQGHFAVHTDDDDHSPSHGHNQGHGPSHSQSHSPVSHTALSPTVAVHAMRRLSMKVQMTEVSTV